MSCGVVAMSALHFRGITKLRKTCWNLIIICDNSLTEPGVESSYLDRKFEYLVHFEKVVKLDPKCH